MTNVVDISKTRAAEAGADLSAEMCEQIKEVIYSFGDRVPVSLAVGVLEIAKQNIIEDAQNS